MGSQQYSLRWNNHQCHILKAFEALLQSESFVDVTLVCDGSTVKAHKVVLSACSPYFNRIFADNPCQHPVVILKDTRAWELQALVDFMYRGEISIAEDQLPSLIRTADALKIRGLAAADRFDSKGSEDSCQTPDSNASSTNTPPPPNDIEHRSVSPTPRRKQARPQKRSEDEELDTDVLNLPLIQPKLELDDRYPHDFNFHDQENELVGTLDYNSVIATQLELGLNNAFSAMAAAPQVVTTPPSTPHSHGGGGQAPMFSAPRGGPPRHWSNENLTEALRNVWSGRMKTAQASRVFGIPYNSLLMYVRGKYGKSLKLDLIKKGKIPPYLANEPFNPRYAGANALLPKHDSNGALNMVMRETMGKPGDKSFSPNKRKAESVPLSLVQAMMEEGEGWDMKRELILSEKGDENGNSEEEKPHDTEMKPITAEMKCA